MILIFTALPAYAEAPSQISDKKIQANIDKIILQTPEVKPIYGPKKPEIVVVKPSLPIVPLVSDQLAFNKLVSKESGGDPLAVNKTSFACGIPQALPCDKLLDYANIKHPRITTFTMAKQYIALVPKETQLEWTRNYIKGRYGNANKALAHHNAYGWY